MKAAIRQRARELGFDDCRFATARTPDHASEFKEWLAEHRHGDMAYLERNADKRTDPQRVLAGVRTVITLAVSYASRDDCRAPDVEANGRLPRNPSSVTPRINGVIARYARDRDYHTIMGEPLKRLTEFLAGLGGEDTRSLWYVDTGPVLERDFAQRAGLGFAGKHTNLISRRLGNWIFLAEILTTLELEPDAPEKNHCGSCTRCIAACPTGAILAPFQLDARRCISYLTIEVKGAIPVELRPAIGNRIYGCDDCLAVCPWNRFAREGSLMKEQGRADLDAPDLVELLALDEAAFKSRFAGTPILRVKRRGLLRNVCVALGNRGDPSALPALQKAAADPEPLIAEHACWAIGRIEVRTRA
jgi:epoxyqueuosine reductase